MRRLLAFLARRSAARAETAYRAYQEQPAGAPWDVRIATALRLKAERHGARAAALIIGA